ncbi:MAG: DNA primase [Pseudomonadota bacterium]
MALPPGFLDDLRSRLTLSEVAGRKVIWDQRKSQPGKGDFWAPCPFHQEKTPSFHVDDRKGFYYCFGCHAKGDMITFVKDIENVSFIEAVEILAREAGVEMPAQTRDPKAAEKRDRQTRLLEVMEQAVQAYGLAFRAAQGQTARDYAAKRGLSAETLKRFEIGYAPDSRNFLAQGFREKGQVEEAVAAGLLIQPEGGGTPYDRFRGRLMFPIRDARGRCIAFGGRTLVGHDAKYLNSPETDLFHKSRVLYHHGPASDAARNAGTVIVAEGYMDVVALAQAGFAHAVAPLGTAVTEEQLALLWRMAAEPVLALDGDKAGLRAADRVVDLALPLLQPGRSLRFCLMPEGQDPDDLIKAGGPEAMVERLSAALPLIDMLWRREAEAEPLDTPERRAALDQRLKAALGKIADPGVRNHYAAELRQRRAALFRAPEAPRGAPRPGPGQAVGRGWPGRGRAPMGPVATTKSSPLAKSGQGDPARIREAAILLLAAANPDHAAPLETRLEEMPLLTPDYLPLRDRLLTALIEPGQEEALREITATLARVPQARAHPMARPVADGAKLRDVLADAIDRHTARIGFETEFAEAGRDLSEDAGEDATWRMRQAGQQMQMVDQRALEADPAVSAKTETSGIQDMLDKEVYRKKKTRTGPTNQ